MWVGLGFHLRTVLLLGREESVQAGRNGWCTAVGHEALPAGPSILHACGVVHSPAGDVLLVLTYHC